MIDNPETLEEKIMTIMIIALSEIGIKDTLYVDGFWTDAQKLVD